MTDFYVAEFANDTVFMVIVHIAAQTPKTVLIAGRDIETVCGSGKRPWPVGCYFYKTRRRAEKREDGSLRIGHVVVYPTRAAALIGLRERVERRLDKLTRERADLERAWTALEFPNETD